MNSIRSWSFFSCWWGFYSLGIHWLTDIQTYQSASEGRTGSSSRTSSSCWISAYLLLLLFLNCIWNYCASDTWFWMNSLSIEWPNRKSTVLLASVAVHWSCLHLPLRVILTAPHSRWWPYCRGLDHWKCTGGCPLMSKAFSGLNHCFGVRYYSAVDIYASVTTSFSTVYCYRLDSLSTCSPASLQPRPCCRDSLSCSIDSWIRSFSSEKTLAACPRACYRVLIFGRSFVLSSAVAIKMRTSCWW